MSDLTARQMDVAQCIGEGMTYAETATSLGIAPHTVRAHVFAIATKLPNPDHLPQKIVVQLYMLRKAS